MSADEKVLNNIQRMLAERCISKIDLKTLNENTEIHSATHSFYYINSNLTIKQARYIEDNNQNKPTICIYNGTATCQAKVLLKSLNVECFSIDYFYYVPIDYQKNITYSLLNEEKKKELKLSLNLKYLPKIHDQDVIARYYGAKTGDIFEIIRENSVYYRIVINT